MSPGSPFTETNALADVDLIWGEPNDSTTQEWTEREEDLFTNAGYREGITAGKEGALQEGFDKGFAQVGAPLGREIGVLRGAANATMSILLLSSPSDIGPAAEVLQRRKNDIQSIIRALNQIHQSDLTPRDQEAEEHAKEHAKEHTEIRISGHVTTSGITDVNGNGFNTSRSMENLSEASISIQTTGSAIGDLARLRIRLSDLLQQLGLNVSLSW